MIIKELINKILNNEYFKDINVSCKFPKMKKENIKIFKVFETIFPELRKEDIIFIKKNENNVNSIINGLTCKCGKFKHAELSFCSRKCDYFKQNVVKQCEETNLKLYGVKNAYQRKDVIQKISDKRNSHSEQEKFETLEKRRKTCLDKYGFENVNQVPEIKEKINDTMNKRYGTKRFSQIKEWRDKTIETNNKKFGADFYQQSEIGKEKLKQTNLNNWGVENVFQSELIKEKSKQTKLEKYNDENYRDVLKMKETKLKRYGDENYVNKEKAKETKLEKYGNENYNNPQKAKETRIERGLQYPDTILDDFFSNWNKEKKPTVNDLKEFMGFSENYQAYNLLRGKEEKEQFDLGASKLESIVENFLIDNKLKYIKHDRTQIQPKELDFYLPDFKVGIEVNDIFSHNSTIGAFDKKPLDKNYHFKKTMLCAEKGIRLIHIFEPYLLDNKKWNIMQNIILHACGKSKKIFARNTELIIKPAIELKQFIDNNNIQGYRSADTAFVLVDKNTKEPLMCYTIGNAYFGKGKYDAEIVRGACKLGYTVVGGASKLWKHIIEYYKDKDLHNNKGSIDSIVYYVNLNYYDGNSMKFLDNVQFVKNQIGFWNYWVNDKQLRNREPQRHKEIIELSRQGKVLFVYNSGTQINVWYRK